MTKRNVLISITAVLVVILVGVSVWLSFNADALKSGIKGGGLYTQGDIKDAYEKGYNGAIGDTAYYLELIETLQYELEKQKLESDQKYAAMVDYYEKEIARLKEEHARIVDDLKREIAQQLEYIALLESYLFDFILEPAGTSEAALELQLEAFRKIERNILADIDYWGEVLNALPDVGSLEAETNAAFLDYMNTKAAKDRADADFYAYSIFWEMTETWEWTPANIISSLSCRPLRSKTDARYQDEDGNFERYMADLGIEDVLWEDNLFSGVGLKEVASKFRAAYICYHEIDNYLNYGYNWSKWSVMYSNRVYNMSKMQENCDALKEPYFESKIKYEALKSELEYVREQKIVGEYILSAREENLKIVQARIEYLEGVKNENY